MFTRAKLAYLRSVVAGPAAEARAQRVVADAAKAEKAAADRVKAEFARQNAPHPLDEAVRRERLAKAQSTGKVKKVVESDIYVSGTAIASRKAPKNPAKF